MKSLTEIINQISEEAKNQFKPDLKKYGKNFRAISESAVLEVLNPLFKKYNISYNVLVQEQKLHIEKIKAGRDQSGNIIEQLIFVADAKVRLIFINPDFSTLDGDKYESMLFEGWGSGVDYGDKATGKAITAAVKYALFKGLRLQYSDDPDAEESQEIKSIVEEEKVPSGSRKEEKEVKKEKSKEKEEPVATEGQLDYIRGLTIACGLSDDEFKEKYKYFPYDKKIPMRKAREIIAELKGLYDKKLPF